MNTLNATTTTVKNETKQKRCQDNDRNYLN